jgi:uncharacterized protein (TIGR03435 family)
MRQLSPLILLATGALAQQFEVASIKPNAEHDNRVSIRMAPGGRFTATGLSVKQLISQAYNVRNFQISGGPGWIESERYDINAKAESTAERIPQEDLRAMLRALLAERFRLKVRTEAKEMPVYALVVSRSGHKLTPSADASPGPQIRMGRGQLSGKGMAMSMLARELGQQLGRQVIDKTGLNGSYDINLEWTPEPGHGGVFGAPPPPDALPATDSSGPTVFTAVQEQLGLRLESQRGPVPVIVIESVDKPTAN